MSPSHGKVLFGKETIRFKLFFVDRKTMEIAVHPDQTVIVKAPVGANDTAVEQKVRKRAGWIKRQLDFFGNSILERPDEIMSAAKPIFTLAGGIGLKSIRGS